MVYKNWFWWAFLVYILVVLLRFYYPFALGGLEYLNTNDGYFYAQGARDLLEGAKSTLKSPTHEILSQITAFLAFILPFSLEKIIFYMPGFFGSLVVFLVMYLARGFGRVAGVLCGILSGIGVSYYNRTMFGYYDTDMFVVVLGLFVGVMIFEILGQVKRSSVVWLLLCSGLALEYYPSLRYVLLGYSCVLVIFSVFGSFKSGARVANGALLMVLLEGILFPQYLIWWVGFCVVLALWLKDTMLKYLGRFYLLFLVVLGLVMVFKVLPEVFLSVYVGGEKSKIEEDVGFYYLEVMGSIAEVSSVGFLEFAYRISGNLACLVLGGVGILLLFTKEKRFLIFLPFLILGFFGFFRGLRFTFYAVPIFALGVGYLLFVLLGVLKFKKTLLYGFACFYFAVVILPHLVHIGNYLPPVLLEREEVEALRKIPARSGDYALARWDYGYFVGYFARLNVLVDGGIHSGKDNYPISFVLSSKNQRQSYNMAKLLLHPLGFEGFVRARNLSFQETLEELKGDLNLGEVQRDLYVILPLRMLSIFATIVRFSNRDLESGEEFGEKILMVSQRKEGERIFFDSRMYVDKSIGKIGILGEDFSLGIAGVLDLHDSAKNVEFDSQSSIVLLDLGSGEYVLCDAEYLDSFYFKGIFFENLDENLFQKVLKNEKIAIYKLKQ